MNSFLQILLRTPKFLDILYNYDLNEYNNNDLIYNLILLSKYPYNSKYLYTIKKIMGEVNQKYGTFEPGDSQTFAIDFIDKLISESKNENINDSIISVDDRNYKISKNIKFLNFIEKYNNKEDEIEKLFQFVEVSSGVSGNLDNFSVNLHIELNFPKFKENNISLKDLLSYKYNKNLKIADLPEILIISFNRGIIGQKLIKTNISFDEILILESYIDKTLNNKQSLKYYLYAINERYGQSKNQGHYICYIKMNNNSKINNYNKMNNYRWYRFSDLYVTESNPSFNSSDVYGLYYVRSDCL
jgi:ubiquitin C-terminal hydrolase